MTNLERAAQRLVVETNIGSKVIEQKGTIPGYGQVWYDGDAISNLFSVSDMVKKGHTVILNTDLDNAIIVKTKDG